MLLLDAVVQVGVNPSQAWRNRTLHPIVVGPCRAAVVAVVAGSFTRVSKSRDPAAWHAFMTPTMASTLVILLPPLVLLAVMHSILPRLQYLTSLRHVIGPSLAETSSRTCSHHLRSSNMVVEAPHSLHQVP